MSLEIFGLAGIPEISPGDNLAEAIVLAAAKSRPLARGDVVIVTQKVVSKAEGRLLQLMPDASQPDLLLEKSKQVVRQESVRILRQRGNLIISETQHGFVCANAGVDLSNVPDGQVALLPRYPDRSAQRIRAQILRASNLEVAVIISDTFGRPWRRGLTDVAIGCAGIQPILDLRGSPDAHGRELAVTEVAIVDELAAAADLVMGKSEGIPVAVVRGVPADWLIWDDSAAAADPAAKGVAGKGAAAKGSTGKGAAAKGVVNTIVRHPSEDLFR